MGKTNPSSIHRDYLDRDIKLLWGLSAARCAVCRTGLVAEGTPTDRQVVVGKMGHIYAHSPGGPRPDATKSPDFLRSYENLILVCGTHHDLIDGQRSTYTVEELLRIKQEHEAWVYSRLEQATPDVGFAELEVVCSGLLAPPEMPTEPHIPTPPTEKLRKNGLTREVHRRMQVGLAMFREVEKFVESVVRVDDRFPERLRAGFLTQYARHRQHGLDGDALFLALHDFASGGSNAFERQAAGMAVLCYLFQKCEVIEP
ncbi:MAG: hypothetical protein MUE50_13900 [Pirellulaceae bacterium]|jgi:hypothetical protein|nr:hypothetical protein [Pirellulaceae bacterium]